MKLVNSKTTPYICFLIGLLIFVYMFIKASVSSFTHDESFTYLNYAHDSFFDLISFSDWFMNNHILNSITLKYSEQIFGTSELALRLPNLIALLIYLFYSYKIFKNKEPMVSIAIFTLLCSNVLVIDLFGLARGYGLSCGLMVMSIYHFIAFVKLDKKKDLWLFHIAAMLAILSHFTLLTFYVAALIIYNVLKLLQSRFETDFTFHLFRSNKVHILPFMLNVIILYEPVRRALMHGQLDVGGKSGFYADTVSDFSWNLTNGISIHPYILVLFQVLVTALALIPLIILIRNLIKKEASYLKKCQGLIITNLFIIIITVIIISHHIILGADYPSGRFSVFLFPIFMIQLGLLVDYLTKGSQRKTTLILVYGFSLFTIVTFVTNLNTKSYGEWEYDSDTKNMIVALQKYRATNDDDSREVKLGIDWLFEPTINFYREINELNWLIAADREGISESDDYIYTFQDSLISLETINYEVIKQFNESRTVLIKIKKIRFQ